MVVPLPFPDSDNIILCTYKNPYFNIFFVEEKIYQSLLFWHANVRKAVLCIIQVFLFFPTEEFFKQNTQYRYDYSVDISSAFAGVSESKSAARIVCGLTLEVPRKCEVAMKVNLHFLVIRPTGMFGSLCVT